MLNWLCEQKHKNNCLEIRKDWRLVQDMKGKERKGELNGCVAQTKDESLSSV